MEINKNVSVGTENASAKDATPVIPSVNAGKIILDLCGGTGSWSNPYAESGYDVHIITLPNYDMFEVVCNPDTKMLEFTNHSTGTVERIKASEVYGILAAPMCTQFSLARTTAKTPRDLAGGMALVKKCLEVIWFCREQPDSKLKFWALENPVGYLRQFLGIPPLTFDPYDYGDTYTKRTDIWGYYKIPKKLRTAATASEDEKPVSFDRHPLPQLPDDYVMPKGWNRKAARRSMTSTYFAKAFYKANK